ncbi:MAG: hypothetical protein CUN55_07925 [Phototrophicales bacterium]|nr:MAG: hypothetical protein CUN55_07925 [Phototrophicales bacterium]
MLWDIAISKQKQLYQNPRIWLAIAFVPTAILALLVFALDQKAITPILQFWLVAVILTTYGALLSSKTVRQARRWHGIDWWMAIISVTFLVIFLIMGIIPEYLAPYKYNEQVGPAFLAPNETPPEFILITREELPFQSFEDIGRVLILNEDGTYSLGDIVERASNANGVGRITDDAGVVIGQERSRLGLENAIAVDRTLRDGDTPEMAFEALLSADLTQRRPLVAIVGRRSVFEPLVDQYEGVRVIGRIGPDYPTPLLGTNNLGEDVFSRLIYGTQTTLIIGISSAIFSCLLGIPLGLISGYIGGFLDRILSLILDSVYSFPGLILAIAIAVVLGRGILTVVFAIAVIYVPIYYRIVRSQTLAIREMSYVEAARSLGERNIIILFRYIFPNVIASVVVIFSINVADAILTGAGLSFLGLGLPETTPDWGVDLARNQERLRSQWWLVTFPGLMITALVLCFSLLGESLSEILNPRLNRS